MFAQALITIILTWAVAEIGCRLVLDLSFVAAVKQVFSGDPERMEGHEDLVGFLETRREELRDARVRLRLTARATGLTENLKLVERELSELEEKLAALERQRGEAIETS